MHEYAKKVTILYVEDEQSVQEGYSRALERISRQLYTADNGREGLEMFEKYHPDIVVSDIKMPQMNGLDMVRAIKQIAPDIKVIFTTAHSESVYLLEAIELQVDGYLLKPVQKKSLRTLIEKLAKNITIEKEYEEQKEILQYIINYENTISAVVNMDKISFASRSFLRFFNVSDINEFNEKYTSVVEIFNNPDDVINTNNLKSILKEEKNLFEFINSLDKTQRIININDSNNERKSFLVDISKISETQCLLDLTDVTEIEKQREEITKKADHDTLTELYNRNKLEEIFAYQLSQVQRYGYTLSLAIADIDHFKFFNDTYGHLTGDEVLKSVAKTLQTCIRSSDTLARWGGEEFVMLFPQTAYENTYLLLEKCKKKIEESDNSEYAKVTLSSGFTTYKDGDTLTSMLSRADEALYEAKANGRNQVIGKE